ncbi:ABC-type multidrug transport system permease subunit [Flavobacterium nitrogenifigens]|uniref:ABC-type multidrug transport system permease subunit n=2 Tax=Flavobacterium TaxID=237 RepID=A0A7W7N7N2_9FLAO|nr:MULTISPECIES: hypothetical protein [Flavobacterium]MBB4801497.1 ABC-type multidrug transport system permease subunit [Flavobacterium nitrogenifigens]MBB6386454.1 ABC-type multidrug transport system permease subunit [Flavobacterium notoginsengisoli]
MRDVIVVIYWILIAFIIIHPNYMFYKKLKNIATKSFIHKLIFFLMSIFLLFIYMCFFLLILINPYINQILGFKIDPEAYSGRIIYASLTFPVAYLTNISIAKFYIKRISKTKNKNEIELIGKE